MKKMFYIGLLALVLCSCSKEEVDTTPKEVEFTLDYIFAQSGSMTRATSAEVYGDFYNNYIKSKQLTPKTYSLTFKNSKGYEVLNVSGKWGDKNIIRLPSGNYTISGTSHPIFDKYQIIPSDSVYMRFEEDITIKQDMSELVLNAIYDSYLLMFDKSNTKSISLKGYYIRTGTSKSHNIQLPSNDDLYFAFINNDHFYYLDEKENLYYPYTIESITINRNDGSPIDINICNLNFDLGKYYYFNDMTNSFDIPPMESGN